MSLVRQALFADRFYPADPDACAALIDEWRPRDPATPAVACVAPHAGWTYSGQTATLAISGIAAAKPDTVVLFGAVHVLDRNRASLFDRGSWQTPFGLLRVDHELATRIARIADVSVDGTAHGHEHSIEVELPLLHRMLPEVKIVPLMVRPGDWAAAIGRDVAKAAIDLGRRVAFLASTDLTHYGPSFGFEPHGRGLEGVRWAKDVNDRRFIKVLGQLDPEAVVPEAVAHRNACGSGAAAATMAAAIEAGATLYREMRHTTSHEVRPALEFDDYDSVGYQAGWLVSDSGG